MTDERDFMCYGGKQWDDPPPTREEAEAAWAARQEFPIVFD